MLMECGEAYNGAHTGSPPGLTRPTSPVTSDYAGKGSPAWLTAWCWVTTGRRWPPWDERREREVSVGIELFAGGVYRVVRSDLACSQHKQVWVKNPVRCEDSTVIDVSSSLLLRWWTAWLWRTSCFVRLSIFASVWEECHSEQSISR